MNDINELMLRIQALRHKSPSDYDAADVDDVITEHRHRRSKPGAREIVKDTVDFAEFVGKPEPAFKLNIKF
jgi:hypothetical protein